MYTALLLEVTQSDLILSQQLSTCKELLEIQEHNSNKIFTECFVVQLTVLLYY